VRCNAADPYPVSPITAFVPPSYTITYMSNKQPEPLITVTCDHCGRQVKVTAEHLRTPFYCC
jgi:hypothetical protein